MTQARRRVAVTRRVDLSPYGDDLKDCYAIVTLTDFRGRQEVLTKDPESLTNVQATKLMVDVVQEHFVSGKIAIINDAGTTELVDMTKEDVDATEEILMAMYSTVMGVTADPKALSIPTEKLSSPSPMPERSNGESNTKTMSHSESNQSTPA